LGPDSGLDFQLQKKGPNEEGSPAELITDTLYMQYFMKNVLLSRNLKQTFFENCKDHRQAKRLTRVPRVRDFESSNPNGRPNLTQRCKRFATASTSAQVAVLPWRYDAEMGTANSLQASA